MSVQLNTTKVENVLQICNTQWGIVVANFGKRFQKINIGYKFCLPYLCIKIKKHYLCSQYYIGVLFVVHFCLLAVGVGAKAEIIPIEPDTGNAETGMRVINTYPFSNFLTI